MCIFFIYSDIYAREENTKILRRFCPFTRCALVTYGGTVDDVRLPQWRSSAEDGDIKRTCVIQDNGRNENQRPKVAVVPSSATRPCRFASPRRGRVSRNSCADERGSFVQSKVGTTVSSRAFTAVTASFLRVVSSAQ
ncbi:uncharacterized protein LOC113004419 [Solenopsis invicta]|uniref:uncharacterized protein LOC113004419 n=1 Tax=Solenopsis invicta TaxID=13686 RepID=UPI000E33D6EE|nr:uncharacterized protein LOC113004419 [Solenopsis invicta]